MVTEAARARYTSTQHNPSACLRLAHHTLQCTRHCTTHTPHTQRPSVLHAGTHHCTDPLRQHGRTVLVSVLFPTTQHRNGRSPRTHSDFSPRPREQVRTSQTLAVVLGRPTNITACTSPTQASRHSDQRLCTHDVQSRRPSPPDTSAHLELGLGPATHSRYLGIACSPPCIHTCTCLPPTLHAHIHMHTRTRHLSLCPISSPDPEPRAVLYAQCPVPWSHGPQPDASLLAPKVTAPRRELRTKPRRP